VGADDRKEGGGICFRQALPKEKEMNALLLRGGQLVGLLGILVMVVSVAARLAGHYTLFRFQLVTLLLAGIGVVSVGCFLLLWFVAERGRH
jgi:hypothetical protein